jgi:hypothetical protein
MAKEWRTSCHQNQIDGLHAVSSYELGAKQTGESFERPSPSNSLKETTSTPHGPFSKPGSLTRVSEQSD